MTDNVQEAFTYNELEEMVATLVTIGKMQQTALDWYADKNNWVPQPGGMVLAIGQQMIPVAAVDIDKGQRAQQTIERCRALLLTGLDNNLVPDVEDA